MEKQIEIIMKGKTSLISEKNLISLDGKFKVLIYIARALKQPIHSKEVNLAKQRVALILNFQSFGDIPYKKLIENMKLIDESIRVVKSFRIDG